MKQTFTLLLFAFLLNSCDCFFMVSGTVLDANSNEPIAGVLVESKTIGINSVITDSLGQFKLTFISGGISCRKANFTFSHHQYEQKEIKMISGLNGKVYLNNKSD